MELERYVRDAKAGWVMGPTNEVLRQFVGKAVLLGFDALDYWNQTYNRRVVENEIKKLDAAGKRELAKQLIEQADKDEATRARARRGMAAHARPRAQAASTRPSSLVGAAGVGDGGASCAATTASRCIDPDGGQPAELTVLAPDGREDPGALGTTADAPATVPARGRRRRS